jgi:hypothetical protein
LFIAVVRFRRALASERVGRVTVVTGHIDTQLGSQKLLSQSCRKGLTLEVNRLA